MVSRRAQYFIEFLAIAGFALFAWLAAADFSIALPLYTFGADGWPKAIILCMAFSAASLFFYRLLQGTAGSETISREGEAKALTGISPYRKAAVFGIPILYAVLLQPIGFYVATFLFLPVYTCLLGERNLLRLGLITGCTSVVIIVLFSKYLYVPFPLGELTFFYDINAFISELMYR